MYPVRWSPDGDGLTYVERRDGIDNVWSQPLNGGAARQLTRFESGQIGDFAWSPDGTRLVLSRGRTTRDIVLIENFR